MDPKPQTLRRKYQRSLASQSIVGRHIHDVSKSIQVNWIVLHVTKILQNFWLTLVIWSSKEKI